MKFPIEPDSPEDILAKEIAKDLATEGFDSGLALPYAIQLMSVIDASHDDPMIGVDKIKQHRQYSDEWWVKYHPHTNIGKAAKQRLESRIGINYEQKNAEIYE